MQGQRGVMWPAEHPNGNVLVTGCPSVLKPARCSWTRNLGLRGHAAVPVSTATLVIQNIVATADLGRTISLEEASVSLGPIADEFEPEQFPGMILRLGDPPAAALILSSGKIVITGTRDFFSLYRVAGRIEDLLVGHG